MYIEEPGGVQPCNCTGSTGAVCIKGGEALFEDVVATKMYAIIYQPPNGPPNPQNGPPQGCVTCTPDADGDWCFGFVSGASCNSFPNTPPLNQAWIWAEYNYGGTVFYETYGAPFQGRCQNNLPPCCDSSSSSGGDA